MRAACAKSPTEKVVVAMSGGVDSSVAALLLHEEGHSIVGVSMQVWDYRNNGGCSSRATCCAPDDFNDARRVAASIGVPYYVFDFEETFQQSVIDTFIREYESGRTPNPCVECNNKVKFRALRERADTLGYPIVATGHYAQILESPEGPRLFRGVDRNKDQSYFLYGMKPDELSRTRFPVGAMTKAEVRARAAEAGLGTASKPESQDICFVSGTVKDFLRSQGAKSSPGLVKHRSGEVLGSHDGIHQFTVGQRRGLRVGGSANSLYVLELNHELNEVVVGERDDLERGEFEVDNLSWLSPDVTRLLRNNILSEPFSCIAQLRHRHSGVPVRVAQSEGGSVTVAFQEKWATVSPGQACVFYDAANREVLGGGKVLR